MADALIPVVADAPAIRERLFHLQEPVTLTAEQ